MFNVKDIPPSPVDTAKGLSRGRQRLHDKFQKERQKNGPSFHLSQAGIYLEDKETTAGTCHRMALLGYFGIELPNEKAVRIMFEGGHGNEYVYHNIFKEGFDGFETEKECAIETKTEEGDKIGGTPDAILHKGKTRSLGIEFKSLVSYHSAKNQAIKYKEPKINNLIQTVCYSGLLQLPFELWYTNRNFFHNHYKDLDALRGSPFVATNAKGDPMKIDPFELRFKVGFNGETATHQALDFDRVDAPKDTVVTVKAIKDFFEFCSFLKNEKDLGPRPENLRTNGQKLAYKMCQYCDLKDICNKYEDNYDEWFDRVKSLDPIPF